MSVSKRSAGRVLWLAALVASGACSALNAEDPVATLQAERAGYITEATSIAQAAQAQGTQVVETAVAAQTLVAELEGRNEQLAATLHVVSPPTQQIINDNGAVTPGNVVTSAPEGEVSVTVEAVVQGGEGAPLGDMLFTQIGTASQVREADDCAVQLEYSFPANIQRIYVTTRGLNVAAGTQMHVDWYYAGELAYAEDYTIPRDDDDFCLWFFIEPTGDVFTPGSWSVSLFANSQPLDPASVGFTIGG